MKRIPIVLISLVALILTSTAHALPKIHDWQTTEGARVLYIHAPELPMVDLLFSMDAGSFREQAIFGLASMTATMMTLGTETLDEHQFSEALELLGSSLTISANTSATTIRMRSLTDAKTLAPTLELLKAMLTTPRFDTQIFAREKAQAIDAQKALLDNPNAIASETYYHALYPKGRLGITAQMLRTSLETLPLQALKDFRNTYYHATNANIVIIGALDQSQAKTISQQLSTLMGTGKTLTKINEPVNETAATTITKPFKGPQSRILMGHPSINRFDPDFFPLMLGNHILGGNGLTSLLMLDIREKQGLTYGISSSFSPTFLPGPFTVSLSTKNESVDHARTATLELVQQFIDQGPSDDDLARAKNNLIGSAILDLSSNAQLAGALLFLATYDLPLDYYDTYPATIKAITKEEIQKAFAKHIDLSKFTTVIVGDLP